MEPTSGTGSGRSNTEFTTANVAVFAAIQTAMVAMTVTVNPLSPIRERTACRRLRTMEPMIANTLFRSRDVAQILACFCCRRAGGHRAHVTTPSGRRGPEMAAFGGDIHHNR